MKITKTLENIYLNYGYINVPAIVEGTVPASKSLLGTLLSNIAYYGFVPSTEVLKFLTAANDAQLNALWKKLEPALKDNSGAGRNISKYVVYKNFPKEVLDMSQAEYWIKQILMYMGFSKNLFTQDEQPRDPMFEQVTLKVLHAADDMTAYKIFNHLLTLPNRWTDGQASDAEAMISLFGKSLAVTIDFDTIGFKENAVMAVIFANKTNVEVNLKISTATDVLRLIAGMSGGDPSLSDFDNIKIAKFKRSERRWLVSLLDSCKHIEDDFAARKGDWKRVLMRLHPGDFKYDRVNTAYHKLYNNEVKSFAAKVDLEVLTDLSLLKSRPGEFLRRFHSVYRVFRKEAVDALCEILPKLSTQQLVKFYRYVTTINSRKKLMYAPRGNWAKVKIVQNNKIAISQADIDHIGRAVSEVLRNRIAEILPEGVALDASARHVKLQTNDQKLASYGRGTEFPMPENIKFIRAASYWEDASRAGGHGSTWMDNGFNFFNSRWGHIDAFCWDHTSFNGAAFSGDPVNSRTADGKACQVIDLYIDKLVKAGVRYAVWNILSFNNIPFDNVDDIFASLQWGEDAFKGKLYEPSRAQMEFKITGQNKCKFIAYIDLVERKLVFMDANFKGDVHSAYNNKSMLEDTMPAYVEYLNSLPSVYDVFQFAEKGDVPVTFSDANLQITTDKAYVFRPENPDNSFTQLDMNAILS